MVKVLLLVLIPLVVCTAKLDSTNQRKMQAVRLQNEAITLDGILKENVWMTPPAEGFTQRDPVEGESSTEQTGIWIAFDDHYVYFACRMSDNKPDSIDVELGRRDSYIETDWINIFLDPYYDKKTGYYFSLSPAGAMRDGVIFNDGWDDNTWDGVWEGVTSIDDKGWYAEFRIPFSQLRFKEADQMTWGINVSREIKRRRETSYFVMVPKKESGFVSRFARLEGLSGIKSKQRFEILPYVVQKAQSLVHDPSDPFYKSNQFGNSIGADIKIGLGSNLNIDASINPDFGQVEVDPAVLNLSAFESYFQEKRPFFIEGSQIFYFGMDGSNNNWGFNFGSPELFYSRRIGRAPRGGTSDAEYTDYPSSTRILGAVKMSGKPNENLTVGAISAITERSYAKLWNNGGVSSEVIEPLTHYGVIRLKNEFNSGNQMLGMIFTTVNREERTKDLTNSLSKGAYVFGLDGYTFLDEDKLYVLTGAVAGSYVEGTKEFIQKLQKSPIRYYQRPDATYAKFDPELTSLSGLYGRFMLNKQSGNFYLNAAVGAVTPGMDYNDLGFQFMSDRINAHIVTGYRWYEPDGIFRNKNIYFAHAQSYDFEGNRTSTFLWFNNNYNLMNYWGFSINGNYSFEAISKSATRGGPLMKSPGGYSLNVYSYTDSREKLSFELGGSYAQESNGGTYRNINFYTSWRPDSRLKMSIGPSYDHSHDPLQWVDNIDDLTASSTFGTRYVFGRIDQASLSANIRMEWTFTPKLSLQLFAQPFLASGSYGNFKELKQPKSDNFLMYGAEGSTITYLTDSDEYRVDPDGAGAATAFSIQNPDFNFKSLRGNLVLRWEALPGSILYVVWSHDQSNFDDPGTMIVKRDFRNLLKEKGNDIFLVKFSYWLDV